MAPAEETSTNERRGFGRYVDGRRSAIESERVKVDDWFDDRGGIVIFVVTAAIAVGLLFAVIQSSF